MVLKELKIGMIPSYRPNAGQYEGSVEFIDDVGNIALKLTPELCEKIFVICADGILDVAKEAATNLTRNVLEHKNTIAIESK